MQDPEWSKGHSTHSPEVKLFTPWEAPRLIWELATQKISFGPLPDIQPDSAATTIFTLGYFQPKGLENESKDK